MVQPNNRVYPIVYISRARYELIKNQLNALAESTKTDVHFNEKEQYFEIKGRSTQTTQQVTKLIVDKLIPHLYANLDLMSGTEATSVDYEKAMRPFSGKVPSTNNNKLPASSARPASPASASEDDDNDSYSDDSEFSYSDDSLDYMRPKKDKGKKPSAKPSKVMQKKVNEAHGTFTFAKNVKDPNEILFGPPFENMASIDYLWVIGEDTATECSLDKRTVQVFGPDDATVNSALEKFRFLQTLHKRLRRAPAVTPCLHYRAEGEYCLYFCDLHDYKDESFVALPKDYKRPSYVLIPSFKDPKSGRYMRPTGLAPTTTFGQSSSPSQKKSQQLKQSPNNRGSPAPSSIYDELDQRFSEEHTLSPNMTDTSSSWGSGQFTERTNAPPGQAPLWGEQKYTTTPSSSSPRGRGRGRGGPSMERPRWGAPPPSAATNDEFPALGGGSSAGRGGRQQQQQQQQRGGGNGGRGRRVMRLTPQKSSHQKSSKPISMLSMAKEYNMHNIKETLSDSLETARQFRGEVTLVAKLGKVLWKNLPENDDKKKIWQYTDIKDVCMKEYKIQPSFNDVSMTRNDVAQTVWRAVETAFGLPIKNESYFEIRVNARPNMKESLKPATLYTESSWANFFKVDLQEFKAAEIDWVSLDAKFDFQLALTMKEIGRKEVAPFKPFIRRVALRPSENGRTNYLSYQQVGEGRLLDVREIYHKQVSKFRVDPNVMLKLTRIETVPRHRETTGSEALYVATTGTGSVSFDIELVYMPYEKLFKENADKPIFEDVKWTQDDIFGENNQVFSKFMAAILQTMNIIENALE